MAVLLLLIINGCKNRDVVKKKPADPEAVFFDCKVESHEGTDTVSITLQFRRGDAEGPVLSSAGISNLLLDGKPMQMDSAAVGGVFYEVLSPVSGFTGKHRFTVEDVKGVTHEETFAFTPFGLKDQWPEKINMKPASIVLTGVNDAPGGARLVMADTSFATKDVNEVLPVTNGAINITGAMWKSVKPGPMVMEIFKEQEVQTKPSKFYGRILTLSNVRREFEALLADSN